MLGLAPFEQTIGHHVDAADREIYMWKKCIQCAHGALSTDIPKYNYDLVNDTCRKIYKYCLHSLVYTFSRFQ